MFECVDVLFSKMVDRVAKEIDTSTGSDVNFNEAQSKVSLILTR